MKCNTGMLVFCSCRALKPIGISLANLLRAAAANVSRRLYVHVIPHGPPQVPAPHHVPLITRIYTCASHVCPRVDVRVLLSHLKSTAAVPAPVATTEDPVQVLLTSSQALCDRTVLERIQPSTAPPAVKFLDDQLVDSEPHTLSSDPPPVAAELPSSHEDMCDHVAVGGTFDCIHDGHKLLLSAALLHCRRTLTVGVAGAPLLVDKTLAELVAPVQQRSDTVRRLVGDLDHVTQCHTVTLLDPLGPTREDPSMNMLVVSEETRAGAGIINSARETVGLAPLRIVSVPVVGKAQQQLGDLQSWHLPDDLSGDKFSSTVERVRQLGALRRQRPNQRLRPTGPYVLGLTGGLASGKSAVCKLLQHRGAVVIDCDKLAHRVYEPGTAGHTAVVAAFGAEVLASDGTINRSALASIVFSNADRDEGAQLARLTDIVWPLTAQLADEAIQQHASDVVVVLEAAVLLEAGWQSLCDEVWTVIVPDDEAVRRAVMRDGCSEEHAQQRLNKQCGNMRRVSEAHVVFCSLWQRKFTEQQVDRAWSDLTAHLNPSTVQDQ